MMWALVIALLIVTAALVLALGVLVWALRDQAKQNARLTRAVVAKHAQEYDILERTAGRPELERAKRTPAAAPTPPPATDDHRGRLAAAIESETALPLVPEGFSG